MLLQQTIKGLTTNINGEDNYFHFDKDDFSISSTEIRITGRNNKILVGKSTNFKNLKITITGSNNLIEIGSKCRIVGKLLIIGDSQKISIGDRTTLREDNYLHSEEGKNISIGDRCMFSTDVTIRTSDSHSVIDKSTNERVNKAGDVIIGDHVWIAANTLISKGVTIPEDCIVGANSVVTKSFEEKSCAIGGIPAKVLKNNVTWTRERL
ncbi:DapH/DapD/GlmU-related protein [Metabacillus halosaccharovorans]|uniref:acyltransferase n=1 Tax=Metabacillus halosaccharovorans TaxID=930124 RepID=UPI0034CD6429